jgi:hypothetical protein
MECGMIGAMEDGNSKWGCIGLRSLTFLVPSVIVLFLCAISTNGQQAPEGSGRPRQTTLSGQMGCTYLRNALQATERRINNDENASIASSQLDHTSSTGSKPTMVDRQYELKVLDHDKAELDKCVAWNLRATPAPTKDCSSTESFDFHVTHNDEPEHDVKIWRQSENSPFFFESSLSIDADGAPNAYHPDNLGLDDLANAGAPGSWWGVGVDKNGEPLIQTSDDPSPGYFVSVTDLPDATKAAIDPTRYVDASRIPYIVLPDGPGAQTGAHLGDFAIVFNLQDGKNSPAIFADSGPPNRIGEGSIALAENLGLWSDARSGGTTRGILYLVFPGSGKGRPRTIEEINSEAAQLFQAWGGYNQLTACGLR